MPITMPTEFAQNRLKTGAVNTAVVVFSTSNHVPVYLISTMDMGTGSVHIHAWLLSISSINEKLDIHRKTWGTNDVTIKMLNPRSIQGDAGVKDRVSELTVPQSWQFVDIYLISGSNAAAFNTKGILRFSGRIIHAPTVTEKTITVKAISIEKEKHKMLPTGLVGTTYTSAPIGNMEKRKSLVYGTFNQNFWGDISYNGNINEGVGLAKAYRIDASIEPEYLVSDHILNDVTDAKLFLDVGAMMPAIGHETSADADDSGDGTFKLLKVISSGSFSYANTTARKFVRQEYILNDTIPSAYSHSNKIATDPENVHDDNPSTITTIFSNLTNIGTESTGIGLWGFVKQDELRSMLFSGTNGPYTPTIYGLFYDVDKGNQESREYDHNYMRLYYRATGTYLQANDITDERFGDTVFRNLLIGAVEDMDLSITVGGEELPDFAFGCHCRLTPGFVGGDNDILEIAEFKVVVLLQIADSPLEAWVECKGREYGSWITASGRSIDSQASGNLIENQAHIIESILRDELGVVTGDIDTDSFDDAYDAGTALANRQARLNVFKPKSSEKIIKGIAEQSTFAFTWTAAGKAKLIPLHSSYWSSKDVDATIPWSHIKPDSLKISKMKIYCNEVEVKSRWHGEAKTYRDTDTTTDGGSQTAYGAWRRIAGWPSIVEATQVHVSAKYVNSSDGLWSQPHLQVQFETLVFTYAHLEIGDAIELDSVSCDPQLKAYGESWSGIKLCVVGLQQSLSGTKITAVELFG